MLRKGEAGLVDIIVEVGENCEMLRTVKLNSSYTGTKDKRELCRRNESTHESLKPMNLTILPLCHTKTFWSLPWSLNNTTRILTHAIFDKQCLRRETMLPIEALGTIKVNATAIEAPS